MTLPITLIMAPIHGVTDAVYRNAFAACFSGFDRAITPFIALRQGQLSRPSELLQVAPESNRFIKATPQVLTNHPQTFSAVLRQLSDVGHEEVNWNLGCPYPMVASRGRGAGLLAEPDRIDSILAEVLNNSPVKLSVKMRLGYHDPDEYQLVMEVLNRYPLKEVILHARTADQMYDGAADIVRAGQMLASCRHPFVYNGDITRPDGFRDLCRQLPGTTAWMVGRGALACPFLPSLLKASPLPSLDTRRQMLQEFHRHLIEGYSRRLSGPRHLMDKMLEQWKYLALSFANPGPLLARIRRSYASRYASAVEWAFDQPLADIDNA
jgi:tRNA-dihydrouridine synthase B